MRIHLALIGGCIVLTGCGPAVHVEVLRPADVSIPAHVQKVAIVDRSAPKNTGQAILGTLEGMVTGEGILEDRDGAAAAIDGVSTYLAESPRFEVGLPAIDKEKAESSLWDKQLSWKAARRIARQVDAQAVVSLEAFDSDSFTEVTSRVVEESTPSGGTARKKVFTAQRETRVIAAWRVYDVENKVLLDDLRDHPTARTWEEEADTRDAAMGELPGKRDTVMNLGYVSGEWYARRIAPTYMMVRRPYYAKGSPDLKEGKHYVRARDWDGAMALWDRLVDSPEPKIRGRAEFNLALGNEVYGDLDNALAWAKKAAVTLHNGKSRDYVYALERRIRDRAKLAEQMAPPPEDTGDKPLAVPGDEPAPREGTMKRPTEDDESGSGGTREGTMKRPR